MMATARLSAVQVLCVCVCVCSCVSDYYALLEVSRAASAKEIKKAFHRLALKHHPDKSQSPNAPQTFTRIAQAYEVLSNKEKRRVYDQMDHVTKRDQSRESEEKGSDPFRNDEDFYSTNSFQRFTLQELLQMLQPDEDLFMGEEPSYDGWGFNFGPEDDDENVFLSDLFNMM